MDPVDGGKPAALDVAKAAAALRWWANAGVTGAIEETPRNRFDEKPEARAPRGAVRASGSAHAAGAAGRRLGLSVGGRGRRPDTRRRVPGSRHPARKPGAVRGLRPETDRDATGLCGWRAGVEGHVRRRGAGRRRGPRRPAVRRTGGTAARPDAAGHRTGSSAASISPMSFRGGRPATARRRRRRPRPACLSSGGRSRSPRPRSWSASGDRRRRRCSASATGSRERAGTGSTTRVKTGAPFAPWRCFTPPISCGSPRRSARLGPTCAPWRTRSRS